MTVGALATKIVDSSFAGLYYFRPRENCVFSLGSGLALSSGVKIPALSFIIPLSSRIELPRHAAHS